MKKQTFKSYGYELTIEKIEGDLIVTGLPKSIVNRIEDHIRVWQSDEFDPSGILEIPTEIESILMDWLNEFYPSNVQNVIVDEDGKVIIS